MHSVSLTSRFGVTDCITVTWPLPYITWQFLYERRQSSTIGEIGNCIEIRSSINWTLGIGFIVGLTPFNTLPITDTASPPSPATVILTLRGRSFCWRKEWTYSLSDYGVAVWWMQREQKIVEKQNRRICNLKRQRVVNYYFLFSLFQLSTDNKMQCKTVHVKRCLS